MSLQIKQRSETNRYDLSVTESNDYFKSSFVAGTSETNFQAYCQQIIISEINFQACAKMLLV